MRLIDADEFFKNYPELDIEPYNNAPTIEERPKGKWIKQADCEGKAISYKCDACGFSEGWCDYKWCPMCGDIKETQPEDDEDDEDGTEIDWPEDLKVLCIRFECIHSDGTGRCKIQDEIDIHGLSCGHYERR